MKKVDIVVEKKANGMFYAYPKGKDILGRHGVTKERAIENLIDQLTYETVESSEEMTIEIPE